MSKKLWVILIAIVVVLGGLVVVGASVPVTLSEPPSEAVVYVDPEGRLVPPHDVPIAESFLYEPMSYGEAVEQGHEPRDPAAMRVTASSGFEAIGVLLGYEPYLQWAGTDERLDYLD